MTDSSGRPAARRGVRTLLAVLAAAALSALAVAGCSSSAGGSQHSSAPPTTASVSATTAPTTTAPPTTSSSSTTSSSAASSSAPGRVAPKLSDFRIADITYVGNQAWALGTAKCLSGGGTDCSAIEHSTNGRSWASLPTPPGISVTGPCTAGCIEHLRFATPKVGYLFGEGGTYLSIDGGLHWSKQNVKTFALESLDGNVIRLTSSTPGCPPDCTYTAQTAAVGGTSWHTTLSAGGDNVELARTASHAYVLTMGNPAGGAQSAKSDLFVSADNGAHWTNRGEPCPQTAGEVDAFDLSTAPGGAVGVVCQPRTHSAGPFVAISTNHATSFRRGALHTLGSASVSAFALATGRTVLISLGDTFRSTDGGNRFSRLAANSGSSPGDPVYIGFATPAVGHAISDDRRVLWTTLDGGLHWTAHTFG